HGTTTLEAKTGFGLPEIAEIKALRVLAGLRSRLPLVVSTYLCASVSEEFEDRPLEYIEWVCSELLPGIKRRRLVEFADIRCEPGAFTAEQTCTYLTMAARLGFGLKIHAGPRPAMGAVALAVRMGITSIDHLSDITEADIDALAQSSTIATLLPGTIFSHRS